VRSKWIEYRGKRIFFQDFSNLDLFHSEEVKFELEQVHAVVENEPSASVLALADFTNTQIGKDLMDLMVEASKATKSHVSKTAVLGVRGTMRILADMLVRLTGQPISLFDNAETAKEWLIK
jgi:hypothetical protein